ncbi:MAG: hypothetical protein E7600_02290 [Ruminococcaceae bacterium]|nr:hypothetical protein [Oscillospiraceae bacterium]
MRKTLIIPLLALILLFTASCTSITEKEAEDMFLKKKRVKSFESITIRESGMRVIEEYAIMNKGDVCEISLYQLIPISGTYDDERILLQSVEYKTEDMIALMNDCGFASWDGFEGKHPKNVSDGVMFTLSAVINDGQKVSAHGSQNFPKDYKSFIGKIKDILIKEQKIST